MKIDKKTRASKRPTLLGNFLRTCRKQALRGNAISIVRAATSLGYDKNSIHAYETGARLPDVQFLAHAAVLYKKDFRTMLGLLLRDQCVRRSDPPEPDPVCATAADRLGFVGYKEILEPGTVYANALNCDLLANILQSVGQVESRTKKSLQPKYKARVVSALYGVALTKGTDYEVGIEYLVRVIQEKYTTYLKTER